MLSDLDDTPAEKKTIKYLDSSVGSLDDQECILLTSTSSLNEVQHHGSNRHCDICGYHNQPDTCIHFLEVFGHRLPLHDVLVASDDEQVPEGQQAVGAVLEQNS